MEGFSLTSAFFSFELEKQTSFYEGQTYVALSRVISVDNLFLIGKNNRNVLKLPLLNIADYGKTDLILFIQIMLIVIVLQYRC